MTRVAVVTGGTRGIGRGICLRLLSSGVAVATTFHRDEEAASRLESEASRLGSPLWLSRVDLLDASGMEEFVGRVEEKYGRLDYLVNNVGIDVFKPIGEVSLHEWRLSQDIILNAPFMLCRMVLPVMRRQKFGRIVNLGASSRDYFKGAAGLGPFGVHKAALTVLTRTLALEEIRNGITVNMVAPGSTAGAGSLPEERRIPVSQIPIGRRVEIDEVVDAVMYFLSDRAAGVTGQFLGVNGGLST